MKRTAVKTYGKTSYESSISIKRILTGIVVGNFALAVWGILVILHP